LAVLNAATTSVSTHAISHCRIPSSGLAWFLVTSLIDVVSFAKSIEMDTAPVEVVANVCNVFFKKWELWIRIPDVSGDAKWVFIAIRQTCFLRLGTLVLREITKA